MAPIVRFVGVAPAYIVSKRLFVDYWEYLIDEAMYTAPATVNRQIAALLNQAYAGRHDRQWARHRQGTVDDASIKAGDIIVGLGEKALKRQANFIRACRKPAKPAWISRSMY